MRSCRSSCASRIFSSCDCKAPLAKAHLISDIGSGSEITCLRKDENGCTVAAGREKCELEERCEKHPCRHKVIEERAGGGASDRDPQQKTMVRQLAPLQPMDARGGVDAQPATCGGPIDPAGMCTTKEDAIPGEEPMLEQVFWQNL